MTLKYVADIQFSDQTFLKRFVSNFITTDIHFEFANDEGRDGPVASGDDEFRSFVYFIRDVCLVICDIQWHDRYNFMVFMQGSILQVLFAAWRVILCVNLWKLARKDICDETGLHLIAYNATQCNTRLHLLRIRVLFNVSGRRNRLGNE